MLARPTTLLPKDPNNNLRNTLPLNLTTAEDANGRDHHPQHHLRESDADSREA